MSIDIEPGALASRIASINVLLRSHAGEIELVDVSNDGAVTVRYTGMCAGCDYRPLTMAGTVEPALRDIAGVTQVIATGSRVSEHALERIRESLEGSEAATRSVRIVHRIESEHRQGTPS